MTRRVLQRLIPIYSSPVPQNTTEKISIFDEEREVTYVRTELIPPLYGQEWKPPSGTCAKRGARYSHLAECLKCVSWMLAFARRILRLDPSPAILASIATLGDLFCHPLNHGLQATGTIGVIAPMFWANEYYDEDIKRKMMHAGWCPNEKFKYMDKFHTIQMLHLLSRMKKPALRHGRNHENCTEERCNAFPSDLHDYYSGHISNGSDGEKCHCVDAVIKNKEVVAILEEDDCIPLLEIIPADSGNLNDLAVRIVKSTPEIPYVATSHVWIDGLGNPNANSLPVCQLVRLRHLVEEALSNFSRDPSHIGNIHCNPEKLQRPLFWLDTLLCPVGPPEHKKLFLQKTTQVYRRATYVLALDSSLKPYEYSTKTVAEACARIFTSSWTRRLWTLQEGASAKETYFQFSNCAVSLTGLGTALHTVQVLPRDIRYLSPGWDFGNEFMRLWIFFVVSKDKNSIASVLSILNCALNNHAVAMPSDEPLCIMTPLSLDSKPIVAVDTAEDRMQQV